MAISSNSLFHVTSSFDNLVGILKEGFRANYCYETFSYNWLEEDVTAPDSKGTQGIYVPMVSFSDIPLREIKAHFKKYKATCAIGLSKDWGIQKGLNPILYTQEQSKLTESLIRFMFDNFEQTPSDFNIPANETYRLFRYILNHTKNYKGIIRKGKLEPDNLAYDEKEWRYIPTDEQLKAVGITKDLLDNLESVGDAISSDPFNMENVKYQREVVQQIRLNFAPEDVRYLIVDNKKNIKKLVELLRNKFGEKAGRLIPTVFTLEQVFEDFN